MVSDNTHTCLLLNTTVLVCFNRNKHRSALSLFLSSILRNGYYKSKND